MQHVEPRPPYPCPQRSARAHLGRGRQVQFAESLRAARLIREALPGDATSSADETLDAGTDLCDVPVRLSSIHDQGDEIVDERVGWCK